MMRTPDEIRARKAEYGLDGVIPSQTLDQIREIAADLVPRLSAQGRPAAVLSRRRPAAMKIGPDDPLMIPIVFCSLASAILVVVFGVAIWAAIKARRPQL